MKHGSLFSGIGGFDLAAEWMGWDNVFHCEWNEFGQKVLKHYWPKSISYADICSTDFSIHRGNIDIVTGGFPCQPYSTAGKRLGKEDSRHLWPEMLRAIQEIQPKWIVGENVLGLVNWSGGLVFNEVQTDLETAGYEVQAVVLAAASVGAPHRRDRIWFVAYSKSNGGSICELGKSETRQQIQTRDNINGFESLGDATNTEGKQSERMRPKFRESCEQEQEQFRRNGSEVGCERNAADTDGIGQRGQSDGIGESEFNGKNCKRDDWANFPTQSPICSRNDGIPDQLDGITFPKWRNESIKAAGNAICPQVVLQIFKAIEQYEKLL